MLVVYHQYISLNPIEVDKPALAAQRRPLHPGRSIERKLKVLDQYLHSKKSQVQDLLRSEPHTPSLKMKKKKCGRPQLDAIERNHCGSRERKLPLHAETRGWYIQELGVLP